MKTFEENFTAWVDGILSEEERLAFEATLDKDAPGERNRLLQLGELLRNHSPAPALSNPDFFNHQLLERIAAENGAPARRGQSPWFVPRFIFAGASCFAAAVLLFHFLIPVGPVENPSSAPAYVAQFYNARTDDPDVSATAFHSKKDNVTVLWLDGLDYLPETADLK